MKQIEVINKVITDYFDKHIDKNLIPAKKLMPELIAAGVFLKDNKNGQPLRQVLRTLDSSGDLGSIPTIHPVRKEGNTFWYFKREGQEAPPLEIDKMPPKDETKRELTRLEIGEEQYVIDLCDKALEQKAQRQQKFEFLLGDLHRNGRTRSQIPCDAYYPEHKLIVEFNGHPHSKEAKSRIEQSLLYAQRKRDVMAEHQIKLVEIDSTLFDLNEKKQIIRNSDIDLQKVADILNAKIKS